MMTYITQECLDKSSELDARQEMEDMVDENGPLFEHIKKLASALQRQGIIESGHSFIIGCMFMYSIIHMQLEMDRKYNK